MVKIVPILNNNTELDLYINNSLIPNAGLGVFTNEFIYKDTFIGFYTGVFKSKSNSRYTYTLNNNGYIDGDTTEKSFINIINDSYFSDYTNNCYAESILDDYELERININNIQEYNPNEIIAIYAKLNINIGAELFYDYGAVYWKSW
jgi:SET domain-containing protein